MDLSGKIQKWGNGLALRVSGAMRDIPGFQEGTEVEIKVTNTGFTVKKIEPKKAVKFPYTEAQLIEGLGSQEQLLVNPSSEEWGDE